MITRRTDVGRTDEIHLLLENIKLSAILIGTALGRGLGLRTGFENDQSMPTSERYNSNTALCITLKYFVVIDNRRL